MTKTRRRPPQCLPAENEASFLRFILQMFPFFSVCLLSFYLEGNLTVASNRKPDGTKGFEFPIRRVSKQNSKKCRYFKTSCPPVARLPLIVFSVFSVARTCFPSAEKRNMHSLYTLVCIVHVLSFGLCTQVSLPFPEGNMTDFNRSIFFSFA